MFFLNIQHNITPTANRLSSRRLGGACLADPVPVRRRLATEPGPGTLLLLVAACARAPRHVPVSRVRHVGRVGRVRRLRVQHGARRALCAVVLGQL